MRISSGSARDKVLLIIAYKNWDKLVFNGELGMCTLQIKPDSYFEDVFDIPYCAYGMTFSKRINTGKYPFLILNSDLVDSWNIYHSTLLHEMVHIWQAKNGMKVNHGKHFKKWRKQIYRQTGHKI